jgi:trypsin-like peptidase
MVRQMKNSVLFATGVAFLSLLAMPTVASAESQTYATIINDRAPAVVSIKYILRMSNAGEEQEQEQETTGVLIDAHGLILCSNTEVGGNTGLLRAFGMGEMTLSQSDVRVLIGDDTEGVPATILARDTELDLAWLQIDEPTEEAYPFIDMAKSAPLEPGTRLFAVGKTNEFFGREPVVFEGHVAAEIKTPRRMFVPSGSLGAEHGTPVFVEGGVFAGFVVLYAPDPEDLELAEDPTEMMGSFILPATEVEQATKRAREAGSFD